MRTHMMRIDDDNDDYDERSTKKMSPLVRLQS